MRGVNGSRHPARGDGVEVAVEGEGGSGVARGTAVGGEEARPVGAARRSRSRTRSAASRFARCSTAGRSPGAPGSRSGLTVFSATSSRVSSTTSLTIVCMVLPEMTWQDDLADALVDAGVEVAAWVPDKRLAPIGERLVARGHSAADAHARGGVLRLRGRLSRGGRDAAGPAPVLGAGQLAQRARFARRAVRLRVPGRAVDARHARRAQPVPDAARPHDRRHARAARRPALPADARGGRRGRRARRRRDRRGRPRARPDRPRVDPGPAHEPDLDRRARCSPPPRTRCTSSSLGTPTSALRAASDDGPHLYMGGSMGTALAAALGVAEKRPDRDVVCLLGDGEALMGAGSFWSLAGHRPRQPPRRRPDRRPLHDHRRPAPRRPGRVRRRRRRARPRHRDRPHRRGDRRPRSRRCPRPAVLEVRYEDRELARPIPVRRPAGRPLALRTGGNGARERSEDLVAHSATKLTFARRRRGDWAAALGRAPARRGGAARG